MSSFCIKYHQRSKQSNQSSLIKGAPVRAAQISYRTLLPLTASNEAYYEA